MEHQRTVSFTDVEDGAETVAIVRVVPNGVGLTLSKRNDRDLEVLMPVEVAATLADALRDVDR